MESRLTNVIPHPVPATPSLDLSVVIVTYRSRHEIGDCLRSLFGGGLNELQAEVIVVDNASSDGTADYVCAEFPAVGLFAENENGGFSRANNIGIQASSGRHVLLLNPDTIIGPNVLRRCVDYLDAQPASVAAMTCRVEGTDGKLQTTCSRRLITPWSEGCRALLLDRVFSRSDLFNREAEPRWNRENERDVECLLGAFMLIRRDALEKIGGLDEQFFLMYEDVDWCKRAGNAGFVLKFWPGERISHLGGQSWKYEKVATYANSHVSALQYFRKHHPRAVKGVYRVSLLGMALKVGLLRLNLLRKPGDTYTREHLDMARAATASLRAGHLCLPTQTTNDTATANPTSAVSQP